LTVNCPSVPFATRDAKLTDFASGQELQESECFGSRCWLNGLFSRIAALAIGIKYYAVKSRLVFYAGQRAVIAVVNYLNGLPGARSD